MMIKLVMVMISDDDDEMKAVSIDACNNDNIA